MALNYSLPDDVYFANLPPDQIAAAVFERFKDYQDAIAHSGYADKIVESMRAYYGMANEGTFRSAHSVLEGGEEGELAVISVNHYRSLARSLMALVTQQKTSIKAKATNTDSKSQQQTRLADGVIEYFMKEKRLERHFRRAMEFAIVALEGHVGILWDPLLGKPVAAQADAEGNLDPQAKPQKQGDFIPFVASALAVARDPDAPTFQECPWRIVQKLVNRWDLLARAPQHKDKIMNLTSIQSPLMETPRRGKHKGDFVPVLYFMHDRTIACEPGRFTIAIDSDTWAVDGGLPYDGLPLYSCMTAEILDTVFGYSAHLDVLPLQYAIDAMHTILLSNNKAFGVQNVWTKTGDALSSSELGGGLKHLQSKEKPEGIQLTKSAPESYQLLDKLEQGAQTISGVNDVVRGNPQESLKSGTALAMVATQAVVYTNDLSEAYVHLQEDACTGLIKLLKRFAKAPLIAEIVGKTGQSSLKEFVGADLDAVERVTAEVANPALRTAAGRLALADKLLDSGKLESATEYLMVVDTGTLDPLTEGPLSQLDLIRKENENLRDGLPVTALWTDKHNIHFPEHLTVLADPQLRAEHLRAKAAGDPKPTILDGVTEHLEEHLHFWETMDPNMLMALGIPPLPAPGMVSQPGMPQPPSPGNGAAAGPAGGGQEVGAAGGPPQQPNPGGEAPVLSATPGLQTKAESARGARQPRALPGGAPPEMEQAYQESIGKVPTPQI